MGLEVARSVLESGGDVICIDRQESPLEEPWSKLPQRLLNQGGFLTTLNVYPDQIVC